MVSHARTYLRQRALGAGLALAMLYLTVLSFRSVMVSYLLVGRGAHGGWTHTHTHTLHEAAPLAKRHLCVRTVWGGVPRTQASASTPPALTSCCVACACVHGRCAACA
jgi:hypothetical protein